MPRTERREALLGVECAQRAQRGERGVELGGGWRLDEGEAAQAARPEPQQEERHRLHG